MQVQEKSFDYINGIKAVNIVFFCLFFSQLCVAEETTAMPTPKGYMSIKLVEPPSPITLSMNAIPDQDGQANADFNFYLKPWVGMSPTELRYLVTNHFVNTNTASLKAKNTAIKGLPEGVFQVTGKEGDCLPMFELYSLNHCYLHLQVNNKLYHSAANGYGPVVDMDVSWKWGSGKRRKGTLSTEKQITELQSLANILPSVLLPVTFQVRPSALDGLAFNPDTSFISGKPERLGRYVFHISASNNHSRTGERDLVINVANHPKDKPVFKDIQTLVIPHALPEQKYSLDLLDFIEPNPVFMASNQVSFRLVTDDAHPSWLNISQNSPTLLQGYPPLADSGKEEQITVVATSNTGGDSEPLVITVPVDFDSSRKPFLVDGIELKGKAGDLFRTNLFQFITDPTHDDAIQVQLEKMIPPASWLKASPENPVELTGLVPQDAAGKTWQLSLRVKSATGGYSDPADVLLKIEPDKSKTPRFHAASPQLPILYPRQACQYDFVANRDIYPEFDEAAYVVELEKNANNPDWVRIEDNKLLIDEVPEGLAPVIPIFLSITNVPGGKSEIYTLNLYVIS